MVEELGKGQVGEGVAVEKKIFYSLAYEDDVLLMATREEELRRMMKRFKRYQDKKSLTLNTDKSKIIWYLEREGTKQENKNGSGRKKSRR